MDPLSSTAAAGLRARLEALDLLANNLANSSTPGFKADREVYAIYLGQDSLEAAESGFGSAQILAPTLERHHTDPRQGVLVETGNPGELALSGEGYFLLEGPDGIRLTRAGRIQIDRDGRLVSPEGFEFVAAGPRPIRADPSQPLEVDQNGIVHQNRAVLGQLRIVQAELSATAKRQGVYFQLDRAALPGLRDAQARVHQGKVEASNVSVPETAVRLVTILRQFETLQKAIQLGGEMGRRAVEDVARVNP
jgi:flagellar basal body rod protein FlgG